jgi:hypothetical protein
VSDATQENCEVAALMFETGEERGLEAARRLDEDTAHIITHHAAMMRRLNVREGGRVCSVM